MTLYQGGHATSSLEGTGYTTTGTSRGFCPIFNVLRLYSVGGRSILLFTLSVCCIVRKIYGEFEWICFVKLCIVRAKSVVDVCMKMLFECVILVFTLFKETVRNKKKNH